MPIANLHRRRKRHDPDTHRGNAMTRLVEFQKVIHESTLSLSPLPSMRATGGHPKHGDEYPKRRGAVHALRASAL